MAETNLYKLAENYCQLEHDSSYKEYIQNLCKEKNEKELEALVKKPLTFGTAGLRAEMGPGFSRMNGLTVIQASQGLCSYLLEVDPEVKTKGVVIGHDHRHHSESFARLAAAIFLSKGIRVIFYHKNVCTPLVPFTVYQCGTSCGIMITASHNPKQYNGYKVYWSNACQEEGKGVLDLSIAKANETGATVILANDPDADRLAIAEKQRDGKWFSFSGNQIGVLIGAYMWENFKDSGEKIAMINSTVSTKMLEKIAKVENFYFEETLTGFKWLGNKAIELRKKGYTVPFAFEEAIGFMCGEFINDKDGISALAILSELAAQLDKKDMKIYEYLESLYKKYGYFMCNNYYFICNDQKVINAFFDNIRYGDVKEPSDDPNYEYKLKYPKEFGGKKIINIRDLTIDYDSSTPDHKALLPRSSQMITFRLDSNDCAITLRTSGTEPKIKYYIELSGESREIAERELKVVFEGMIEALNVRKYNLK